MTELLAALIGYGLAGWLGLDPEEGAGIVDTLVAGLMNPTAGVAGGGILAALTAAIRAAQRAKRIERSPSRAAGDVAALRAELAQVRAELTELRGKALQAGFNRLLGPERPDDEP